MTKQSSSRKSLRSWKARRAQAERMFEAGERQAAVARSLGVSRQCVHNWYRIWQGADADGLVNGPRSGSGRKPKLSAEQLVQVEESLRRGPRAFGFGGDRWTLARIAATIKRLTGIAYHPSSVWRILRGLGWTLRLPPKPTRQKRAYVARHWTAPDGRDGQ